MTKILAYRFSAFGDVAMASLVVREFLEQNPEVELLMVSRDHFAQLFDDIPRLNFKGVDLDDYKGVLGLNKLAKELTINFQPDFIADLHDVIRTKIIKRIFRKKGYSVSVINKGKEEREELINIWNLDKKPIRSTVEKYADVFRTLGFNVTLSHKYQIKNSEKQGIGFAPFAQHKGKMLPLGKSYELAKILSQKHHVYFFGGGQNEIEILKDWEYKISNTTSLAGKLTLKEELDKIASLKVMISMDSANMHLASLAGTRCVSFWGATHYYAGFLGYGQSTDDVVHVKDLTCRPCSVFGDKECYRGDYACLEEIDIQKIIDKI